MTHMKCPVVLVKYHGGVTPAHFLDMIMFSVFPAAYRYVRAPHAIGSKKSWQFLGLSVGETCQRILPPGRV